MAISISFVLVFGVAVWVLYRYAGLKIWHAFTCIAFGFYLATSSFAPEINSTVTAIVHAISGQG
jgi:hypothetical protein